VIVRFIDIGGIVDHHCCNFLTQFWKKLDLKINLSPQASMALLLTAVEFFFISLEGVVWLWL
jgi:hypothetical protein